MAKIVTADGDNLGQFVDDFNNLASVVGGDSDDLILATGDADIITAIVRLDSAIIAAGDANTLNGQAGSYYLDWDNFSNKPTTDSVPEGASNLYYTTARANAAIDARVTNSFVDGLGVDALTLGGRDSDYLTDWANIQNVSIATADIQDSAVNTSKIKGGNIATVEYLISVAGTPLWASKAIVQGAAALNFEDGATADQDSAEIQLIYDTTTPSADSAIAAAGTSVTIHTWSPAIIKEAIHQLQYKILPTDSDIKTGSFVARPGVKYMCNTTSSAFNGNLEAGTPGDLVGFVDYGGNFDTNNLTVVPNGTEKILGGTGGESLALDKKYMSITLEYVDNTKGWVIV